MIWCHKSLAEYVKRIFSEKKDILCRSYLTLQVFGYVVREPRPFLPKKNHLKSGLALTLLRKKIVRGRQFFGDNFPNFWRPWAEKYLVFLLPRSR